MSARVFLPMQFSTRTLGRSSSDGPAAVARVRRDLFGPVDHEDAQAFVDKELAAMHQRQEDRWGFDFVREEPKEHSRFVWEKVQVPQQNLSLRIAETTEPQQSQPQKRCRQSQMTDFLKCTRKRSASLGDVSVAKKTKESHKTRTLERLKLPLEFPKAKRARTTK